MTAGRGSAQKRHARDSCFFSHFSACNCRPKMVCYEQIVKGDIAPLSEHNRFIIASQAPACQGVFAFSGDRPRFFCVLGGEKPERHPARGKKAAHRKVLSVRWGNLSKNPPGFSDKRLAVCCAHNFEPMAQNSTLAA